MLSLNLKLFKIEYFLKGLWPLCAVAVIYFQEITGSYITAMMVFAIINIFQALTEIPTGIVSDKIGRKKTIITANLLIFTGYLFWALAGSFNVSGFLYFGAIFVGIGKAFFSGTDDAFAFETIRELDNKDNFYKIFATNRSFDELGITIGALSATVIYYFYPLKILAWAAVIPAFCGVLNSLFYTEPTQIQLSTDAPFKHFKKSFQKLVFDRKLLKISAVKIFHDSLNAVNWRFAGAYYAQLIAPWLINIVRILQETMGYISYRLAKHCNTLKTRNYLFSAILTNALIKLCGVIINTALTPFIMASSTILYGISTTLENNLLQQRFSDEQRATMGSVLSMLTAVVNVFIFLTVGTIADVYGARTAIFLIMTARILIAFLYRIILK